MTTTDHTPAQPPSVVPSRPQAASWLSKLLGERITTDSINSWSRDPTTEGILPRGGGEIALEPLLHWCRTLRRRPGRPRRSAAPPPEGDEGEGQRWILEIQKLREEIRRLKNINSKSEGTKLDADDVHAAIIRASAGLKDWLSGAWPAESFDMASGKNRTTAVAAIGKICSTRIEDWKNEILNNCQKGTPRAT